MAAGKRIWIRDSGPYTALQTYQWQVAAAATIKEGMFLKQYSAAGEATVIPFVTGDHTIETDEMIVGLAADDTTATAAAVGVVNVYVPLPGIVYEGYATTGTGVDTQAEINALCGDQVVLAISATTDAGDWTIGVAHSAASAFVIVGGDPVKKTLWFMVKDDATLLGNSKIT